MVLRVSVEKVVFSKLALLALMWACFPAAGFVHAQPQTTGTLLVDFLPPYDLSSTGSGFTNAGDFLINDHGQVGGSIPLYQNGVSTGFRPFRWTYGQGYELLEMNTPPAADGSYRATVPAGITNNGQMAGNYTVYDSLSATIEIQSARWNSASTAPEDLEHLPGSTNSQAHDINEGGAVVGRIFMSDSALGQRAVRWDVGTTTPTELGGLGISSTGATSVNALGMWINDAGTAVGTVGKYDSTGNWQGWRAVRWDAGTTTAVELAAPTGLSWTVPDHFAQGINEAGMVYGKLWDTPSLTYRGVRWDATGNGTLLQATAVHGAAIDETEQSVHDMNLAGTVVGESSEYGDYDWLGTFAVKWDAGGGTPTVLAALDTTSSGYSESAAYAINDSGTIAGYSADFDAFDNGTQNAVVWLPDGTLFNLNTLPIAHVNGEPGSWFLNRVTTMGADGWAAGSGLYDADGTGTAHDWVSTSWSAQLGFGGLVIGGPVMGPAMRWSDGRNWSSGTPALEIGRAIFNHDGLRQMFLDRYVRTQGLDFESGETSLDVDGYELAVDEPIRIFSGARLNLRTAFMPSDEWVGFVTGDIINEGIFSPGNSPGLLSLNGNFENLNILEFEIAGIETGQFDQLLINGEFAAGGTFRLVLDGYTPVLGDEFDLMTWEALDWNGMSFDFSAASLSDGLNWDTSNFQSAGQLRVVSAVPEPSLGGLLVVLTTGIVSVRRSRRRTCTAAKCSALSPKGSDPLEGMQNPRKRT